MAHATVPATFGARSGNQKVKITLKGLAWTGIVSLAIGFVSKYVVFYYRHYDAASLTPTGPEADGCSFTLMGEHWPCSPGPFNSGPVLGNAI